MFENTIVVLKKGIVVFGTLTFASFGQNRP